MLGLQETIPIRLKPGEAKWTQGPDMAITICAEISNRRARPGGR